MKALLVIFIIVITVICFSFSTRLNKSYNNLFSKELQEFRQEQTALENTITGADLSSDESIQSLRKQIESARLKLKNIDFWLRYFEPDAYRRVNGPLPVEWENEVFEKFEPPYRRQGAGLSLVEISLGQKPIIKDSLLELIKRSRDI